MNISLSLDTVKDLKIHTFSSEYGLLQDDFTDNE